MRRLWPALLLLLGLAAFGGFAWLTRHPESPLLARAAGWPVVGPAAAQFRERYLGAQRPTTAPVPDYSASPGTASTRDAGPDRARGAEREADRVEVVPAPVLPRVWIVPGDALRREPADHAPVVAVVDVLANVTYTEERGPWRRVLWRRHDGWVRARPEDEPPLGREPDPVLPLPGRPPDPAVLATARRLLDDGAREGFLGPYRLYTDVADPALFTLLEPVAASVEASYRERYGVTPVGRPAEAVVVFRGCDAYRAFLREERLPAHAAGNVSRGVVALCRQGRLYEEVRATLVHELVHVLNRRAIGPALPPWLDEGIAADLAQSRVEGGRLLPGTLAEVVVRSGPAWETHGALAAAEVLRSSLAGGQLVPLADLVELDAAGFRAVQPPVLAYAEAGFLVRFLLAGEHAQRFRAFLAAVAAGASPNAATFEAILGVGLAELDAGYRRWLATSLPQSPR